MDERLVLLLLVLSWFALFIIAMVVDAAIHKTLKKRQIRRNRERYYWKVAAENSRLRSLVSFYEMETERRTGNENGMQ